MRETVPPAARHRAPLHRRCVTITSCIVVHIPAQLKAGVVASVLATAVLAAVPGDEIKSLPGWAGPLPSKQYSGLVKYVTFDDAARTVVHTACRVHACVMVRVPAELRVAERSVRCCRTVSL